MRPRSATAATAMLVVLAAGCASPQGASAPDDEAPSTGTDATEPDVDRSPTDAPADTDDPDADAPEGSDREPAEGTEPEEQPSDDDADDGVSDDGAGDGDGDGPLAFAARALDGDTVDLGRYAGGPVALWMWAPW